MSPHHWHCCCSALLVIAAAAGAVGGLTFTEAVEETYDDLDYVSLDPIATVWPVIVECENMTITPADGSGFNVTTWGRSHYYGATFSNTFVSRKALLHSTADSIGAASSAATIPLAGIWYVAVRYEAPFRFASEFTLSVKQGSAVKLSKLFGKRTSEKIWAFGWSAKNHEIAGCGLDPTPECHWTWGATENWVWEYYPVTLAGGAATFTLSVTNTTSVPSDPRGDRNIDAILLTQNLTDIKMRELSEQQLALDGLFTQHDEVFVKIVNRNTTAAMGVGIPFSAYHSAYASQHLICIPYCKASAKPGGLVYSNVPLLKVELGPGKSSLAWVEVGSRMDSFNDGTWTMSANITGGWTLEFGVKVVGSAAIKSIGAFTAAASVRTIQVAFDANTIATQRIRFTDASLGEVIAEAKSATLPPGGRPPTLTPIFGYSFCKRSIIRAAEPDCSLDTSVSPEYAANLAQFNEWFPLSDTSGAISDEQPAPFGDIKRKRGYFEARSYIHNLTSFEVKLKTMSAVAQDILVVSLGDEISLVVPRDPATAQALFVKWCAANKVPVPGAFNTTFNGNVKIYWYSSLFSDDYGLQAMSGATALLRKYLPNANIGANYAPLTYSSYGFIRAAYMYPVNKAVTMFRKGAMTLPWGEDYSWQSPIGTQQMSLILLDLFRAGTRGATTPQTTQTMFYTMAHAPGNTAMSWRRNFYGYLGHGATFINLYELRTCTTSYTENYVDAGWGMYAGIRTALAELSLFEDIIQTGRVTTGDVGLWASDAFDIWGPVTPPSHMGQHQNTFLAAKRALYIMLLHAELPVDIVVEDDIGSTLNAYKYMFLADTHVSNAASIALSTWVHAGGVLVATAGAGMFDELNGTNTVLRGLLGVAPLAMREPATSAVQYVKQDVAFAEVLGKVAWETSARPYVGTSPILGARHVFTAAAPANVVATFDDTARSAAAVSTAVGTGRTMYFGFLPGLSYFLPAIPKRPADRGGTDASFTHFVPSEFDWSILDLLTSVISPTYSRQVECSNNLVHGRPVVAAGKGIVVPLVNWSGEEMIASLNVTVRLGSITTAMKATMASGAAVVTHQSSVTGVGVYIVSEFSVADALILRV